MCDEIVKVMYVQHTKSEKCVLNTPPFGLKVLSDNWTVWWGFIYCLLSKQGLNVQKMVFD